MKTTYLIYHSKYKDVLQILFLLLASVLLTLSFTKPAAGDDIDIYGLVSVPIEPNVMIVFDTSGSMGTADVVSEDYNPAKIYKGVTSSATFNTDDVYYQTSTSTSTTSWTDFKIKASAIICPEAKEELINNRIWIGYLTTSGTKSACATSGTKNRWITGNYRNYLTMPKRTREAVAKEAIANLINTTDNVRFGLFRFNGSIGGKLLRTCGATKAEVIASLNAITSSGNTPLGNALADVGLYFAGMQSWSETNVRFTSPIQYRCQKNYVIYMTDGEPNEDSTAMKKMTQNPYINGDYISTVKSKNTYIDDVAKYLFEQDVNPSIPEKQNIITYTIGFMTAQDLLQRTATWGGGAYYTASNSTALSKAFQEIMSTISEQNASFVSPAIPRDKQNNTYAGNSIYMGFFRPQQTGVWNGNIKKYGLDSAGNIVDIYGAIAIDAIGRFYPAAQSYWSSSADGPNVAAGGVGERLAGRSTPRNIYTYMGQQNSLTNNTNNFVAANDLLLPPMFNVATDVQKDALISTARAETSPWPLRDILHSDPVVVYYPSETYIFAGSNGGMMHCFRDSDGDEMWGYIPPDLLPSLNLLNSGQHSYFVDGAPVIYNGTSQKILFFGERRGGSYYTALDITDPAAPSFLYTIGPDYLGGGNAKLGQSWGKPGISRIRTASGDDTVFILPGGYDTNHDMDIPAPLDSVGKAIFSVRVSDGSISSISVHAGNFPQMTHAIVDVLAFDYSGRGYIERIYAGDLAGNVFAMRETGREVWETRKFFSCSAADGINKKIFYAPDAVKESFGETIVFTTGDRENPTKGDVENRIYSIKNDWPEAGNFTTITESDLVDVTDNLIQLGTVDEKAQAELALKNSKGWFIRLENSGERGVSSPVIFDGVIYFTTYTPVDEDGTPLEDPCMVSGAAGIARLYAINYKTGEAVLDLSDEYETDRNGNIVTLGKKDRSTVIGGSMPSAPVIAIGEGGPKIYVGVEGGIGSEDPLVSPKANIYYWRQLLN